MKNIREKISYLQGLAQGLDIEDSSKEGKVLSGIIEILGDMTGQMEEIEDAQYDLEEYVETIDEDLYDLEDEFFGDELDDEMVEVKCPNCKELVCFEADIVDDNDLIEVTCPNCDEVVYVNDQDLLTDAIDADTVTNKYNEDF
ncbi:MAG: AraC family transcriptional regulator [Thermincola sp.]|jgi:phage FluMu protein Com|nr:AraC family transcriptional regulator [Thermincola sp.]MDT3703636.1 AraC family transcriptional regulator [Thermincola sp.]